MQYNVKMHASQSLQYPRATQRPSLLAERPQASTVNCLASFDILQVRFCQPGLQLSERRCILDLHRAEPILQHLGMVVVRILVAARTEEPNTVPALLSA